MGQLATTHLIEQGRRAIAHITGPAIVHAKRRADGYHAALKAHRIRGRAQWLVRGGFMEADGYRAMKRLLGLKPRIDAVFAANDPAAIGAMKAIWEAGLRVPEDMAVVGVGDIALGDLLRVPLTTVSWSREDQGRRAAELILGRIESDDGDKFRRVVIPPHLVVRRSSGGGSAASTGIRGGIRTGTGFRGGALRSHVLPALCATLLAVALPLPAFARTTSRGRRVLPSISPANAPAWSPRRIATSGEAPVTVTASRAARSAGGLHDFFSEGDYWWPDPQNPDGPYIQRDGMSNPDNFNDHRRALMQLSVQVPALAAAWKLTGDRRYADHAVRHLRAWFVDPATRMNPNLQYAQAIHGRFTGRGTGIIDTIHLVEVARAIEALDAAPVWSAADKAALRGWFTDYLRWLTTHPYGIAERDAKNNHGTCWVMQVAAFAHLTGDQ